MKKKSLLEKMLILLMEMKKVPQKSEAPVKKKTTPSFLDLI